MSAARSEANNSDFVAGRAAGGDSLLRLLQQVAVVGRQLRRTMARCLADLDLNDTELLLLWVGGGAGDEGIAQNRLAAAVGLSPAQVSGLVERMGRRGWIVPRVSAGDRRRRLWQITAMGRETLDQVLAQLAPAASVCETDAKIGLDDLVEVLSGVGDAVARGPDGDNGTKPLRVFSGGDATGDVARSLATSATNFLPGKNPSTNRHAPAGPADQPGKEKP